MMRPSIARLLAMLAVVCLSALPGADDSAKVMDGGYTAIEVYINGLAVQSTPAA